MTLHIFWLTSLGEGAAHHSEVLCEGEDLAALNLAIAGDDCVAQGPS